MQRKSEQIFAPATICTMRYDRDAYTPVHHKRRLHSHGCDVIAFIILVPWAVPLFIYSFFFTILSLFSCTRTIRINAYSTHCAVTDTNCINNTLFIGVVASFFCCCSYEINANCDSNRFIRSHIVRKFFSSLHSHRQRLFWCACENGTQRTIWARIDAFTNAMYDDDDNEKKLKKIKGVLRFVIHFVRFPKAYQYVSAFGISTRWWWWSPFSDNNA